MVKYWLNVPVLCIIGNRKAKMPTLLMLIHISFPLNACIPCTPNHNKNKNNDMFVFTGRHLTQNITEPNTANASTALCL